MEVEPADDLEELIEQIDAMARSCDCVDIHLVMEAVGPRSFGPVLLAAGLIMATPLSGILGVPTVMAVVVFLFAVQLLLDRRYFWLPGWVLERSISSSRLRAALKVVRRPAVWLDKPLRPRLKVLTHDGGSRAVAVVCILFALITPPLELMPFATTIIGAAVAAFGLALIAHDGLLVLLTYVATLAVAVPLVYAAV